MKTKLFALIFVLVLVVCAFAACGGGHTHSYASVVTPPDCATGTDGYTTFTCECGDTYTGDEVTAAHIWVSAVVEATCQAGGYTTNTCVECGATETVNQTETDPAKHIYATVWSYDATQHWKAATCGCEDAPLKDVSAHDPDETNTCKVCGEGVCTHPNAVIILDNPATCEGDGIRIFSCADCGLENYQQPSDKLGHDYDEGVVVDPTCTEMGYTLLTCQREGCDESTPNHTAQTDWDTPLGHEFDSNGVCSVCYTEATVTVTYVYPNDVDASEVTNYNDVFFVHDIESPTYYLLDASRPNTSEFKYHFVGWFLDEAFTLPKDTIDTSVPQNLVLYAKWDAESTSNHQHSFEIEWDFDEYEHWKNSTCEHRDQISELGEHKWDNDSYCEVCGRRDPDWEQTYTVTWSSTEIIIELNEDSNNTELPASSKRYLAGATADNDTIDSYVDARNAAATQATNVTVKYAYLEDGTGYSWGANIDHIYGALTKPDCPDVFVNFVYDMLASSLKACFANLKTTQMGENMFQFTDGAFKDTGTGYMLDYMESMTLSLNQMYLLSSDYFIDMVRAFLIVPVNLKMLNSVKVDDASLEGDYDYTYMADKYNSDRDGDGDFDVEDFYKLIWQNEWNYETLADFAVAVYASGQATTTGGVTGSLNDDLCFAIATGSGLSASGMLYTTTIEIIHRDWSDEENNYTFYYPTTNTDLLTFCNNISALFTDNKGVIAISNEQTQGFGTDALRAIRSRFASGNILFGGVICLGSLEYDEYINMEGGFGVVPVPLYRTGDENGRADDYQTQIHNLGRVGAISRTTSKFTQCSAYLDYQSTHSTNILNDYYENKLSYGIAGGSQSNVEMLQFIRRNVRSSFDKAFEDAIGIYFSNDSGASVGGEELDSMAQKWHSLIKDNGYVLGADEMKVLYDALVTVKETHLKTLKNTYKNLPK